ncbi:polysaccharide export protein, partial [Synechococcus sp. AH-224-G16]|nr:polysaccharide export protein [Synechococcus sp. AH-224-G16]
MTKVGQFLPRIATRSFLMRFIHISSLSAGLLVSASIGIPAFSIDPTFAAREQTLPVEAPVQEDIYIIGPGDVLDLKLFDAPELSGPLEVLNDGSVSLPLVGPVRLSGLTIQQASLWTRDLLSTELLRPELQLRVVAPRPIRVSVVGAVERPGLYSLSVSETTQTEGGPALSISGLPTVVDAIQKAGGITQQANLRVVQLQRRLPGTPAQFKRTQLNLLDLVLEGDQLQNPFLFDGDTIKLERAEETPQEAIEL